jgi:hypothetical protein
MAFRDYLPFTDNVDSSERTYGGKPVDEYKELSKPRGYRSERVVRLDEPRVAWKVGEMDGNVFTYTAIKLVVPAGAKVVYPKNQSSFRSTKLRTNAAYVAEIQKVDTDEFGDWIAEPCDWQVCGRYYSSGDDSGFTYREGSVAVPDDFDRSPHNVCTHGIHVYARKETALKQVL